MEKNSHYILAAALLGLSVFLHSPLVAISAVAVFALRYAKDILLKQQENAEINSLTKKVDTLTLRLEKNSEALKDQNEEIHRLAIRAQEIFGGE